MSAAWLTPPVQLHSSRAFECGDFTPEQCHYYQERWRFWYIADYVYALPTIAFFMCTIGIFIIGHTMTQLLDYRKSNRRWSLWTRSLAGLRYLSYRGFRISSLEWNTAPLGVLLLGAAGTIYFFCMDLIPQPYYWSSLDWGSSPPLATRSGWMALACLPFVFATASKTNWITLFTGVSHEKIQVFHRWTAYAFFILSLLHTFPFIVFHIRHHDMVMQFEMGLIFYWTGIVAIIVQAWLTFASFGPFRNLGYEFFKVAHFAAVILFVLILFWHCDYTLTSWDYFIGTAAVYVPCLVYPWLRTAFEYGFTQRAKFFMEDNGFLQITIPANFRWVPGQHCFLRFPSFGIHALSSHPFTICSLPSVSPDEPSSLVFYVRRHGGFTIRLSDYAQNNRGVSVPVIVDGPYGGIDTQRFYESDRLLLIAGGSGAGWVLAFIEQFVRCQRNRSPLGMLRQNNAAAEKPSDDTDSVGSSNKEHEGQSLRVILATRDTATRVWFHKAVDELLAGLSGQVTGLNVEVFLTGEAERSTEIPKDLLDPEGSTSSSSSSNEKVRRRRPWRSSVVGPEMHGRPNLAGVVHDEAVGVTEGGRSLGVFACGPLSMQNDIRNATAQENLRIMKGSKAAGVYLHLEHFSWA